ncbi:hypothetical protein BGZ75_003294 [Mortierella antarctica]|nr:hypothetical protein BGZ75_003294 [Mortierella antarctica]
MTTCFRANNSDNSNKNSSSNPLWDKWRNGQIEVMINGAHEDEMLDTKDPSTVQHKGDVSEGDVETWDDAFDFDSHQPFEHILEQLQHTFPRSPLSDVSDQSDYFQPAAATSSAPITINSTSTRTPASSYTHALPSPSTTTTATTLTSSKGTHAIPTFSINSGSDGGIAIGSRHTNIRRFVGTTDALLKVDTRTPFHNIYNNSSSKDRASALPPLAPTLQARDGSSSKFLSLPQLPSSTSSPSSSASSSPRAVTASVGAPSTTTASTRSMVDNSRQRGSNDQGKARDRSEEDDFCPVLSTTAMTTITQEMMLSNLPAYAGIITRINPIKRVAAWVDDLEDLEVPEEDLDFNQVRSILAKSSSVPDTLESIETWDTDSERSAAQSEDPIRLSPRISAEGDRILVENIGTRKCSIPASDTIETLDDDFDLSVDSGPLQLRLPPHPHLHNHSDPGNLSRKQSSLLRWQDLGSDLDENDLENRSLSSSGSLSRVSMIDEDLLDGIVFPESMENLRLITDRPYRPERDPSVFGKESRMQEDDPEEFWEGLEISDNSFNLQGRNKHLFVRPALVGRERSSSRVRREVVPLKDFVALPSRIPRLCRAPGDTSRPVTPAPSLSRMHSAHFDLPLRNLNSKSSLPRLKRSSISRREGSRVKQAIFTANPHARIISSELDTSVASTPFASRAPTPTAIHIPGSKRSSLYNMKDDFPSLGVSSLAARSVSFTEPAEPATTPVAAESTTVLPSMPILLTDSPAPGQTQGSSRAFPTLRMLVRKLDLGRPRLSARGLIPAFGQVATPSETWSTASADVVAPQQSALPSVLPLTSPPLTSPPLNPPPEAPGDIKPVLKHPPNSRSSSFTDWGSAVGSTETVKESRSSSRVGPVSLGDISELATSDFTGEIMTGASDQVAVAEKFSRRVFLKRSPKQSMFGDGSELDRFDNLPTFGMGELPLTGNEDEIVRVKALQYKRQSIDRVAMWLRKPQSIVNMKEAAKPIEVARPSESEGSSSSIIRKTKSIRRSLFDIFTQVTQATQLAPIMPTVPPPLMETTETKKKRTSSGPTLIRDLSLQPKVRKVSGMVYNPKDKMWDGNDDILDDFEDEDAEVAAATSAFASPATSPRQFEFPGSPLSHAYFPNSPLMGTASISAVNRPALITNMNQHSKPRMQVAGKMVFDPIRMCWIINPEYLHRRKQQQQRRRHRHGDHTRQRSMDDAWGDEPDVFAGLSESDKSQDEDELQNDEELNERVDLEREGRTGTHSQSRSNARRLLARPSFQRQPSHDCVAEQERLQAWAETMVVPNAASHDIADPRSLGGTGGFHSVIPKSSRRSLNGHHGTCSGGVGSIGGGNSSRGEFEVGVEFDITDTFLEQCIAAEAQHRKGAGRFFALPCSPVGVLQPPAAIATTGRLSKMISLGKKSGKAVSRGKDEGTVEGTAKVIHAKEQNKKDIATNDREMEMKVRKLSFPTNPLMSWPPRGKGKSRSKSIQALLLSGGSNSIGQSSGHPMVSGLTDGSEQCSSILRRNSEGSVAAINEGGSGKDKSNGKDKGHNKSNSRSFSRTSLLPSVTANSDISRRPAVAVAATLAARGRGGSRELFFHRPVRQEDTKRGTLSFAATLAAARRGGSMPFDRRKIGADTFDPLRNSQHKDGQHQQAGRAGKLGIGEEEKDEEEDTVERGYRIMPNSRGRPPLRPRAELVLEFERHGQRYR